MKKIDEWLITCELFAPYSPEENPVELFEAFLLQM